MEMMNKWLTILKPGLHSKFYFLFSKPENETDEETLDVEAIIEENYNLLTSGQQSGSQ
jgi:hypothetical protein